MAASSRRSRSVSRSCAWRALTSLEALEDDLPLLLVLLELESLLHCWRGGSGAFGVRGCEAESHGDLVGSAGAVEGGVLEPQSPQELQELP